MLFPTIDFAVFFVIVFTGSWMLRPYPKAWRWFLLLSSCVFYLDPFNPTASAGQTPIVVNLVIVGLIAGSAAATSLILKAAFGTIGGAEATTAGARASHRRRLAEGAAATDPDADGDGDTSDEYRDVLTDDEPAGDGGDAAPPSTRPRGASAASIWAPLVVGALLLVGNIFINGAFPDRIDQSSRFLFLLIGVALLNQTFAMAVFNALGPTRERTTTSLWLVRIAVLVDLLVLGYFKYTNWFLESFSVIAEKLGLTLPLQILLPIAISFFTFQAISYVVDVGRGELRPVPLLDFTVYLTFFAHVVAGPIVRVKEFVPQLNAKADPRFVQSAEAFELIFRGLFKKVVISSFLATQIVDPVFASPSTHGKAEMLWGILGYAIQIYADFSGYTDIAIGIALLLGIRFPQNFDAPYRALSLQDFWRRWHMTLSRWLRDYLYIPLGGNRVSYGRTYFNLWATMVIGGIWHGANWTFVVWGAIHGFGLAIERWVKERWKPLGVPAPIVKTLQWALTFVIVCLAWVFFRATDMANAFDVLGQLFTGEGLVNTKSLVTPMVMIVIVLMIASQFVPPRIPERISIAFARVPPIFQVLVGAAGLALISVLGPEGVAPFIYFQF
jgi:alginate O-acetyltransferase complex protein AlgI